MARAGKLDLNYIVITRSEMQSWNNKKFSIKTVAIMLNKQIL